LVDWLKKIRTDVIKHEDFILAISMTHRFSCRPTESLPQRLPLAILSLAWRFEVTYYRVDDDGREREREGKRDAW
jgi:hypothetical protein